MTAKSVGFLVSTTVGFGKGEIPCGESVVAECWVCSEVPCGVWKMAEFAVVLPSIITILLAAILGVYI